MALLRKKVLVVFNRRTCRRTEMEKSQTFSECGKRTAGHVTRMNQSAPQALILVERSAKLKVKEQLIVLRQGRPERYDPSSSDYFDTDRRKNARTYQLRAWDNW